MLYLILLDYLQPLPEVEIHLAAHREFLARHYAAGHFLLSGRREPRTGGVILARAESLAEVSRWVDEDPFRQAGIARHEIIAWVPGLRSEDVPAAWVPNAVVAKAQPQGVAEPSMPKPDAAITRQES